jgi:tRNA dimethylallyltransferase
MDKPNVIIVVGQTATGKSALAVRLAKKFNGEVISADSRQIYKGLNIGSGKITKIEMKGVPHHLLDVADPKKQFSVVLYKKLAEQKIKEILARGKVPIFCGGTGFYIDAITKGFVLPEVPPNNKLRKELGTKPTEKLLAILMSLDPVRAKSIDPKNKVRIIRAIEIAKKLDKVPEILQTEPKYNFIKIGLKIGDIALKKKIKTRLRKRLRSGMAIELYNLKQNGVSWKRFLELGFDQKYVALYLQKKIDNKKMLENLFMGNWHYAKRQNTWFKRDLEIKWFSPSEYTKIKEYLQKQL